MMSSFPVREQQGYSKDAHHDNGWFWHSLTCDSNWGRNALSASALPGFWHSWVYVGTLLPHMRVSYILMRIHSASTRCIKKQVETWFPVAVEFFLESTQRLTCCHQSQESVSWFLLEFRWSQNSLLQALVFVASNWIVDLLCAFSLCSRWLEPEMRFYSLRY